MAGPGLIGTPLPKRRARGIKDYLLLARHIILTPNMGSEFFPQMLFDLAMGQIDFLVSKGSICSLIAQG